MGLLPTRARLATLQLILARYPGDKRTGASQDLRLEAFRRYSMTLDISWLRNRDAVPDAMRVEPTKPLNRARALQQTAPGSARRAWPSVITLARVWGVTA